MATTMSSSRSCILKGLLALAVTFLLLQFIGLKIFMDKTEQRFDSSGWGIVKRFVDTCNNVQLPVFVVEPSLLRALRGGESSLELWNLGKYPVITFGVIEPSTDELNNVLRAMEHFDHLDINSPDPREMTIDDKENYRLLPSHYFLWHPHSSAPILHLVIFYRRGDYYWHASIASTRSAKPPIDSSHLTLGQHAGSLSRFPVTQQTFRGIHLSVPADSSSFIWKLQHDKFVECNYARARHFFMRHGKTGSKDAATFRRTARQLLSVVLKTLDSMEVPFWLSSGTCLGWYRQCDVIPYSKDVDIGIKIDNYREEMITALEMAGLQLVQQFGKVSDSLELSFMYSDIKLDIFFFYEEDDHIWNGGTQASTGKKFKYFFPKFTLSWTEFLGLRVRVPDPPLPYIEANYGKEWEKPVKEWDWKRSPPNVRENGEWPLSERDQMVQLFEWEEKKGHR